LSCPADGGEDVRVGWIDTELVLVALAAMLSPTTLTFCVLALVLGERPLRTGVWFYTGALGATLAVGVLAAFVLGDAAATSHPSTPKTWVAILDIVFAVLLVVFVMRALRRPVNPEKSAAMIERMSGVASSPAIAIVGAGAALANPGGFIPIALKTISETNPSAVGYIVEWLFFTLVSLLPLAVALVMLVVAPERANATLQAARGWLERHARTVAAVIILVLAAVLLRNGIAGLAG
jgi:Sap-like sulfolipid-1-addressing protein